MKKDRPVIKALLMVSQIGISMIVPIFLAAFLGYRLDGWLGTGFFFLVFLLFGILAAFRNIYKLTKPFYADDLKREQQEQAYWDSLRKERAQQGQETIMQYRGHKDGEVDSLTVQDLARKPQDMQDAAENSRAKAEEEFALWRREREKGHDGEDSHDGSKNGG
ncbi:MAG: AtpZ/AtpI family protein [Lachnospiraceae bacterium]|nr:AtpZ/AtpI family protein [Lachnospiraceae bacterium]